MTQNHIYGSQSRVGRSKEFEKRITLPMSAEMLGKVDQLLVDGEPRLDMIREAVDREIKRRERRVRLSGASGYQDDTEGTD